MKGSQIFAKHANPKIGSFTQFIYFYSKILSYYERQNKNLGCSHSIHKTFAF